MPMDWSDLEGRLSSTERGILRGLAAEGRASPQELAEYVDVTPEYVRDRLRELERLGVIANPVRGTYEHHFYREWRDELDDAGETPDILARVLPDLIDRMDDADLDEDTRAEMEWIVDDSLFGE